MYLDKFKKYKENLLSFCHHRFSCRIRFFELLEEIDIPQDHFIAVRGIFDGNGEDSDPQEFRRVIINNWGFQSGTGEDAVDHQKAGHQHQVDKGSLADPSGF